MDQVSIELHSQNWILARRRTHCRTKPSWWGVLNLGDETPETPEIVAGGLRAALEFIPPERIIAAPDCGLKYLPRESARAKLRALAEGTAMVNAELQ